MLNQVLDLEKVASLRLIYFHFYWFFFNKYLGKVAPQLGMFSPLANKVSLGSEIIHVGGINTLLKSIKPSMTLKGN